jgi:hypothetical protein
MRQACQATRNNVYGVLGELVSSINADSVTRQAYANRAFRA